MCGHLFRQTGPTHPNSEPYRSRFEGFVMRGGVALYGDVCVTRLGCLLPHGVILQGGGDFSCEQTGGCCVIGVGNSGTKREAHASTANVPGAGCSLLLNLIINFEKNAKSNCAPSREHVMRAFQETQSRAGADRLRDSRDPQAHPRNGHVARDHESETPKAAKRDHTAMSD